jgi:hypothetical protein
VLDLGTMLCDLSPHRRHLKHLASLVIAGRPRLQRGPTVPATLDGVALAVVRLDDGVQRRAFVAWLSPALCAASCTQTARARLLPSVTARRLAAGATVFAQLVLTGLNPCLEVEEEGRQLPHQGQHGFFALHVGSMPIVSGREVLGYHGIYCALLFAVLHEEMLASWYA